MLHSSQLPLWLRDAREERLTIRQLFRLKALIALIIVSIKTFGIADRVLIPVIYICGKIIVLAKVDVLRLLVYLISCTPSQKRRRHLPSGGKFPLATWL